MEDEEIECWVEEALNYKEPIMVRELMLPGETLVEYAERAGQLLRWEGDRFTLSSDWSASGPLELPQPNFWTGGWSL